MSWKGNSASFREKILLVGTKAESRGLLPDLIGLTGLPACRWRCLFSLHQLITPLVTITLSLTSMFCHRSSVVNEFFVLSVYFFFCPFLKSASSLDFPTSKASYQTISELSKFSLEQRNSIFVFAPYCHYCQLIVYWSSVLWHIVTLGQLVGLGMNGTR